MAEGLTPKLSTWRAMARDPGAATLGVVIAIIVALLVLPPIWTLLRTSFALEQASGTAGGFTLQNYAQLVTGRNLLGSTWNSFVFAICSTIVALAFGGVLAWLVERTDVPLKSLAYVTTIVSLGMPFILYVTAWIYLLGRAGPLNDIYRLIVGGEGDPFNVHSMPGMVLVAGFLWSPLVFLLLSSTFRAANAEMEEAARMAGASVFESIRYVSLQLARPAILALALFVFVLNLEAFEVPALIGMPGRVNVLTTDIFRSVREMPPKLGYAAAFSVILIILVSVLLYFYAKISKQAERYASITGKGYRPRTLKLGRGRWPAAVIILFNFTVVLLLPILSIAWIAVMPFVRPMRLEGLAFVSTKHFQTILSVPYYRGLVINTLTVAFAVATIAMLLTLFAGWLAARRRIGGQVIDQLIIVPLVFPGIVLGVALLELALHLPIPVYGTLWLIGFAFIIRYIPFGMRYSYAGVLQIHPELEQAAGVSGASTAQNIRKIVFPLLVPALTSGWLFIFLLASKEMSLPLLLAGSSSQTISVAMFELWSNGQGGEVAALGLLWTAMMSIAAAAFYVFSRRQSSTTFGH
jgi:iron(III) transport system permease protein